MAFRLAEARVLLALPYQDQYLVAIDGVGGPVTAVDTSGMSSMTGVRGGRIWRPGDRALAAVYIPDGSGRSLTYLLDAGVIPFPMSEHTEVFPVSLRDNQDTGQFGNPMFEVVHAQNSIPTMFQDRSFGRPADINPGDWYKQNALNGVLLLSDFLRRFGVSPRSYEEEYAADELVRKVFHDCQAESPTSASAYLHRGSQAIGIEEFAATVGEGLGGLTLPPFIRDPENLYALLRNSEEQAGFFRHRRLFGGMAQGDWITMSAPPQEAEIYRYRDIGETGLFSREITEDGIYRLKAAREIRLEKTGAIPVPVREAEPNTAEYDPGTDPGVPSENELLQKFGLQSVAEYEAVRDILRDSDLQEYEHRHIPLRKDRELWYLPSVDEVKDAAFGDTDPPILSPLTEQQREYSDTDLETLLGAVREIAPGRRIRLMKSSSVFLMTEDGGFVIGDGFGGEIRMHRGTISISSAGDTIIDSGRDFIQQTGGNHIQKARKRMEISSSNGSVMVKAQENFHATSGNGGEGSLVLENNARDTRLNDQGIRELEQGGAVGGGIYLRSNRNSIGMYAPALYAGPVVRGQSADPSRDGLPDGEMDIWFNAGYGSLHAEGRHISMQGRDSAGIGIESSAAGLYMRASSAVLTATEMQLVTSSLYAGAGRGSVNKPYMTPSGVRTRRLSLPSGNHRTQISGGLSVKEGISSKGRIATESSVVANSGCNPDPLTGTGRVTVTVSNPRSPTDDINNLMDAVRTTMEQALFSGRASEYGQKIIQAAFPKSESPAYRAQDFKFTGHTWQGMLPGEVCWLETKLNHDILGYTMPFPGREVYDSNLPVLTIPSSAGVRKIAYNQYPVNDQS